MTDKLKPATPTPPVENQSKAPSAAHPQAQPKPAPAVAPATKA